MKINMSHGNGSEETAGLINDIFIRAFGNKWSEPMQDAAALDIPFGGGKKIVFTTDSYVVKPLFFPGGDIGRLAVCGTVNDLLTTGGNPLFLSASFIIEEGMETDSLSEIAASMRRAADEAGVYIVTGDTKVIEGKCGVYINTSGIGTADSGYVTTRNVREGDAILVSGTLGDHHACILSSRMGIKNGIESDAAPLTEIVRALRDSGVALHGMRDITRGGLATVLNEMGLRAVIDESSLPVSGEVRGLCGILGLEPVYMGNEGKMLVIVPREHAQRALEAVRNAKYGENAAVIGHFTEGGGVVMRTALGAERFVPPLTGEGLPRIC